MANYRVKLRFLFQIEHFFNVKYVKTTKNDKKITQMRLHSCDL